jgi:hypothetical protein
MKKSLLIIFLPFIFCGKKAQPELKPTVDYATFKKEISNKQSKFNALYVAGNETVKDSLIKVSRDYVFETITSGIFDYWYGTPWHFYGQTTTPGKGTIACGYFVTTVLSDAGLNIPRIRWAQLASEEFIVKLSADLKRFHKKPVSDVLTYLKGKGDGLYVVGLDCHTGFIYVKGDEIKFVHSNYYQPEIGVMAQDLDSKNPLNASKYRILGKLLDDQMMEKWLLGTRY